MTNMLTNKIIRLYLKFLFQKIKEKCYTKLPINKQDKYIYSLKNKFILKDIESQFRNEAIKNIFGVHAGGVVFNSANGQLIADPKDVEISSSLGDLGQYDWHTILFLEQLIDSSTNLYILGAHIGCLLIPLSRTAKNVVAFEANPLTYKYLQQNILLNKIETASIYNLAVYNSDTTIPFYQNKANTGGSKIKPHFDRFIYHYDQPEEIQIKAVQLDNFVYENNLPVPDFLIVDIEGSEFQALEGAKNCLESCKYLYIEFVPHHLYNVSHIDVDTFYSVIEPYFDHMQIISGEYEKYIGADQIRLKLKELYANNIAVDLLFF